MEDIFPHNLQKWLRPREAIRRAAAHKGQAARRRAGHAAGNRRVNHLKAAVNRRGNHGPRAIDINGRAINHQRAFACELKHAARLAVNHPYMFSSWEHGDNHICAANGCFERFRSPASCRNGFGDSGIREVKGANLMPRFNEVSRHAAAHIPKPDKCNFCHGITLFLCATRVLLPVKSVIYFKDRPQPYCRCKLRAMMTRMISFVPSRI